ncbi:helix-turn-helix transcriptional regulator [Brevibacillus antibioticus]|uniref:Helix-turn-helix transcriptional regulator n=1 Tax=Brevibacillus antibioticus TaxID=2570228 RepID=A0A4U2YAN4_9BACL|nr:helix-turn-helix transcriptional regulator [Brevibacillus antibioticus]TKI57002.1 helix-turn-helix transcriptional regulator [Brevibacillus antibioticus]
MKVKEEGRSCTTLGELIKNYREQAGITLSELARKAGISKAAISRIERERTKRPQFTTIKPIADILGISLMELMEQYIEVEKRPDVLQELLLEAVSMSDNRLVSKVADKFLESPCEETETTLERLFDLTGSIIDETARLSLYKTIISYARYRGVQQYLAKGLLQQYLIERMDLGTLEESFKIGEEILHYTQFLSREEKVIYYYRMALHAHNIKKYKQCIELGNIGHREDTTQNELKERVALAICNSYSRLGDLIGLEEHLDRYEKLGYAFIIERLKYFRAIILSKSERYDKAIPLLKECLEEATDNNRLNRVNDLLEALLKINDVNSIQQIIEQEEEDLHIQPTTPYKYSELGKYYKCKGAFLVKSGLFDDGIEKYLKAMYFFSKINATADIIKCSEAICIHYFTQEKEMKPEVLKKLGEVYNIVNKGNTKEC